MASRAGLAALLLVLALGGLVGQAQSRPSTSTSIYTVRVDPRLCPSPFCGGYWAALANHATTRCADGLLRPRCYVANAVGKNGAPLEMGVPDGALARATIGSAEFGDFGQLGVLRVVAVFTPLGDTAPAGPFVRITDTGLRCIRAPCFSMRASRLNRSYDVTISGLVLSSARLTRDEETRVVGALATKEGVLARGRVERGLDGGRVFHATRFYLRSQS